jgi:mannose-6-phosphate isomerase-like protein (cupin superfamily)
VLLSLRSASPMADYTIKNLQDDVEDMAPKFGLSPDIEAHFARDPLQCNKFGLSLQRMAPNVRYAYGHHHKEQEEVYVILEGSGRVKLDDEVEDVKQWDAVRVGPDTVRCFEAGSDGLTLVVFGAPKMEPQDVEMIPNWWAD